MKPGKLEKISDGKYFVKDGCTYVQLDEKSSKKLCNFYVSEIAENYCVGKLHSYKVTLTTEKGKKIEISVPTYYLSDPYACIRLMTEDDDFKISCIKKVFNEYMEEIIALMYARGEVYVNEAIPGWSEETISYRKTTTLSYHEKKYYSFNKVENPFSSIEHTDFKKYESEKPANRIFQCMEAINVNIAIPLFSFMLLSLLNEFQLLAENKKPDLIMAITGGKLETRRQTALFFTNLYKREPTFKDPIYKSFHMNSSDKGMDIKLKAMSSKDCPFIAFEPDKNQLGFILKKVYHTNDISVNEESNIREDLYPVRSLCVVTCESVDDMKADNIINIRLDDFPDICKEYKKLNDVFPYGIDSLTRSINYYIAKLAHKMCEGSIDYVKDKYNSFCENFMNRHPETQYSDKAYESTMLLLFAFKLFMEEYDDCEISEELYQKAYNSISRAAEDSFPLGGIPTYTDFDNAKRICREVDAYFVPARKKKQIAMLGQNKVLEDIWLWYDKEFFYVTADSIENILKIGNNKLKPNIKVKKALHQKELIKVHKKADDSLEYTVHYQRPLYCDYKTKKRFVAFNREKCKEYNLFENLENFCTVPQLAENTTQEENTTVDNSAFAEHLKSILAQNRTN